MRFFENMDRVNRAIQESNDLETALNNVLNTVLSIFDCDRAFLIPPRDPESDSWRVPLERTRPEYPGVHALGLVMPMDADIATTFRILQDADGPVTYGPGNQHPLPRDVLERFGFKSQMSLAIHPKADNPWHFGIHQCSRARVWAADEKKLFQEIGRRLADGLTSLLAYRTLQASEQEYRTLVENTPYGIARYDLQGHITYFNPLLEKLLDISTAEARGKRPTECFPRDIYQDYEQAVLQVAASGEETEFELHLPGEGGVYIGLITMVAERDADGNISGVLAIGRNFTAQRQAEIALQKSEELYRSMVTAMIEGVIVQSQDGIIVSINPAAEKILNQSADKVLNTSSLDGVQQVLTTDGKPFPDDQFPARVSLRTGQPQSDVEIGLCRVDGEVVWILVNSQPLFMEGEIKPYAVVSTFHDITERKRSEAEKLRSIAILKENEMLLTERLMLERRLSRMANHVPGFLYTFEMDASGHGSFPYVSSGIRDIYGLQPEDFMADMAPLLDMAHPDDKPGLEAALTEAVRNVSAFHYEYRICHPAKGVLWVDAKSMPTVMDDGGLVFHGFMQDITERKLMEKSLIAREQGLRSLAETSPGMMGSFYLKPDGSFCMPYTSPNIQELFGLNSRDVAEDAGPLLALNHPDDAQRVFESTMESARTMTVWHTEYRILHPSRGERWMEGHTKPIPHPDGGIIWYGYVHDITERKQMEATIRKREEEFRILAENLPDIIIRYDTSFRRIYINKLYSKMLEPLGVDLWGKTPQECWCAIEPNAHEFTRLLQQVIDTGNPERTLIQGETRAGPMIYWTMNLVPEFDQEGRVTGVLSCATDITALKEYHREVEVSRAQLRALATRSEKLREDERKHIARELHDDLGQRLTALKLDLSRLMLRFGQNNPELRRQVQEMEADMTATIQLVRDVATSLRPSVLEMGIVSALEWLAHEFRKRTNVSCRLRIPKHKLALDDSQATALFRIVQESLTNIMRYAMASKVEIVLASDHQHYVLEISDNGVGFDAKKRKAGSFGLIGIEERALSLGGDMRIETAADKGLKLTVRIPVNHAIGEAL